MRAKIISKYVTLACFLVSAQLSSAESNVLRRVDYQQTMHNESQSVELGVVKLYFQKEPMFNVLPSYHEQASTVFFFPLTHIEDQEYKKMVDYLGTFNSKYFTVRLESVIAPVQGVKLSIYHDPNAVEITHEFFQSSDLQPGVIFRMHNKVFLQQLENKQEAFLSTAYRLQSQKMLSDFFVVST